MATLRHQDLMAVLDMAGALAAVETWHDMATSAMPQLTGLMRADGVVFHEIDITVPRELRLP